jgi:glycine hydroxymethyltransferase
MTGGVMTQSLTSKIRKFVYENEKWRKECLNLNAAESALIDDKISNLLNSDLSRRAVLGTPGNRYSEGYRYIDDIERILDKLLKKLFNSRFSEWRPLSASVADGVVIHALTSVGDRIVATPSPLGHPTWHENGYAGFRGLKITDLPMEWESLEIDYDRVENLSNKNDFTIAIEGRSLIMFPPDFRKLRDGLGEVPLWYDGAHVMGLIACRLFPNPLDYGFAVLSGSTQKTFSGPLGGIILSNDSERISSIRTATSNDTATPDYGRIAALAATCSEWIRKGNTFGSTIVRNAKALAASLTANGIAVLHEERGFTETHQVAMLSPNGFSAEKTANKLTAANIITTPFPVPDGRGGTRQVLRLGTTEITRNGLKPSQMQEVADAIRLALTDRTKALKRVKSIVRDLKE